MILEEVSEVLRGLSEPVLVLSGEGALLAANPAASQLLSRYVGERPGRGLPLVPDASAEFRDYLRLCARSREPLPGALALLETGGGQVRLRCEGRRLKLGEPEPMSGAVLLRLEREDVERNPFVLLTEKVAALTVEVRRRQCVEAALRDSEARFRRLVEMVPQLVWMSRVDGAAEYLNPRWSEYAGLDMEGLRRGGLRDVLHPEDRTRVLLAWHRCVKRGGAFERELRLRRASDGAWRWFLGRATPMRDAQGRVTGWFGTCTDIQEQRRAMQDALEAVGVRDDFLSVAAHELKTPLTSLKLQVQLLSRSLQRGGGAGGEWNLGARLQRLARQIDRLDALNNCLLDVSRLRSGRLELALEQVDLSQRLQDVLEESQEESARVGCELRVQLQRGVVGWWDGPRLEQVFVNLLGNALKYGQGKPVEVSLRADEEAAVLEVRDSGIGIPVEAQARIFQKFERAVSPLHFAGLGLGLYICRQIVESMAGTIAVESSPGAGACFRVCLPRRPPPPAVRASRPEHALQNS